MICLTFKLMYCYILNVTGEGLDDGVEVLYEMILKRRKLRKKGKK